MEIRRRETASHKKWAKVKQERREKKGQGFVYQVKLDWLDIALASHTYGMGRMALALWWKTGFLPRKRGWVKVTKKLRERFRLSDHSVRVCLQALEDNGLVKVERTGHSAPRVQINHNKKDWTT